MSKLVKLASSYAAKYNVPLEQIEVAEFSNKIVVACGDKITIHKKAQMEDVAMPVSGDGDDQLEECEFCGDLYPESEMHSGQCTTCRTGF